MVDWAVIVLPVIIAAIVFFAVAPEAGKKFAMKWRIAIIVLCVVTALLAFVQQRENARDKRELKNELAKLRTVAPLRKQAADLSTELFDFYHERQRYNDRFTAGQALSKSQTADALKWHAETVAMYHAQFEKRVVSVLEQIRVATGMDVTELQADAKTVKHAPGVEQIATRLSAFAASLP